VISAVQVYSGARRNRLLARVTSGAAAATQSHSRLHTTTSCRATAQSRLGKAAERRYIHDRRTAPRIVACPGAASNRCETSEDEDEGRAWWVIGSDLFG
jgi:hypothetical protein